MTEKRIADPKDWYKKYFDEMKIYFELKQNAIQLAMDKVDKIL
jgi:hypothetical protein